MTTTHRLSDALSVAPQIEPGDLPELARQGFRVLIDNRPDGEVDAALQSGEIEAAARAAGMAFRYVPFPHDGLSEETLAGFAEALALPGPALAYCRSGTRSAMLWALAQSERGEPDEIIAAAAGAGYDLSHMAPMLAARRRVG